MYMDILGGNITNIIILQLKKRLHPFKEPGWSCGLHSGKLGSTPAWGRPQKKT